jgi:hypothetical protein
MFVYYLLFIATLSSCTSSNYDVTLNRPNGITSKFKCRIGKDTLNSTRYDFYNSVLLAEVPYINGNIEGTATDYYYTNGNVNSIMSYKNNKANGIAKKFAENGNPLGRNLFINGKQVLFEKIQTNVELPVDRKTMLNLLLTNGNQWAGEKYIVTDEEELRMGEYTGIYADIIINDTVSLFNETEVIVKFTFPKRADSSTVLIGDFDKSLNCNDTVYYNTAFTLPDSISFTITHEKPGNQYMVGSFKAPALAPETIYFFKGYYVKKENE